MIVCIIFLLCSLMRVGSVVVNVVFIFRGLCRWSMFMWLMFNWVRLLLRFFCMLFLLRLMMELCLFVVFEIGWLFVLMSMWLIFVVIM